MKYTRSTLNILIVKTYGKKNKEILGLDMDKDGWQWTLGIPKNTQSD